MARFAHIADVHLGGWKQPELQQLNLESFKRAIDVCIKEKLDFVLIAGDLFDSAYPPIEILKEAFGEFKRLKEAKIPCFLVAGSHDYSVSGKTFLDVLEKAGFCKNVADYEADERTGKIILNPTLNGNISLYGYPGKKSGLEILDLRKIKLNDTPGLFKIFMLHTTLDKAKGNLPIDAILTDELPKADYYALGHLHIDFQYENFIYPGPLFPNNFQELEDIHNGSFYIVDTSPYSLKKVELKIKGVESVEVNLTTSVGATEKITAELKKRDLKDKIVLLRVAGELENGKTSDIKFQQVEEVAKQKEAFCILRNTHDLTAKEVELNIEIKESENIEEKTAEIYSMEHPSDFNSLIPQLMSILDTEKQEDEKTAIFETRLLEEAKKLLKF